MAMVMLILVWVLVFTRSNDTASGINLYLKLGILELGLDADEVKWVRSNEIYEQQQHQYLYVS